MRQSHAARQDLPDLATQVKVSGRIIGRRKASSSLLFVDLEADGHTLQVMVDNKRLEDL